MEHLLLAHKWAHHADFCAREIHGAIREAREELVTDSPETVPLFPFTCKYMGANSTSKFLSFVI